MRRGIRMAIGLVAGLTAGHAEILDRLAVSVGSRVITEMDLDREIRITALLNNDKPDFSPAHERQAAERMVDQTLVRGELEASRYLPPSSAEIELALQEEKTRYGSEATYRHALAEYGVTEEELKGRLAWQLMLLRFIDARFRPGIQIGEPEILAYFNQHMRAGLMAAHPGQTPSVDDYRAGIEQTLIGQAADEQVEQWLKEARRRTPIRYHDEVFR